MKLRTEQDKPGRMNRRTNAQTPNPKSKRCFELTASGLDRKRAYYLNKAAVLKWGVFCVNGTYIRVSLNNKNTR